jgi:pimeloyl-ACP methyl ester carboxylesterase
MQISLRFAAGGAALLVAGAYARRRSAQALRANPPRGNFVEAGGLRLHYVEKGAGTPLVLLHGLGSMAEDFATSGFLERAAARYRVIALDRPGYGHSDPAPRATASPWRQAALLREVLGKLDVRRPILLGHSWGTLVALAFALRYPGTLRSLVLASGYFFPTARLDALLLAPPAIPGIGDVLRYTLSPCLGRLLWPAFLRLLFSPSRPPPGGPVPPWLALRPAQLKAVAAETLLTIPAAVALSRRYPELTLPLLIVAGAKDRYVSPRSHSLRLKAFVPRSRLVLLPDAGHMLHHSHADAILAEMESLRIPENQGGVAAGRA